MRIGTIHAFCQSLLRRFPLEARISPHFQLVDDRDAADDLAEAREDMLRDANLGPRRDALVTLAGLVGAGEFQGLLAALLARRDRLEAALALGPEGLEAAQRRVLGVTATDEAAVIAARRDLAGGSRAARRRSAGSPPGVRRRSRRRPRPCWAGSAARPRIVPPTGPSGVEVIPQRRRRTPRRRRVRQQESGRRCAGAAGRLPSRSRPGRRGRRISAVRSGWPRSPPRSSASPPRWRRPTRRARTRRGLLDYDDLIGRTARLLVDPGAAWVLYKLDGGLDHLLLDEVQDTAPAQWRIAERADARNSSPASARATPAEACARTRVRGRRPQAVHLLLPGRRRRRSSTVPRAGLRERVRAAGSGWRDGRWTCRSARPRRCWRWWMRCSPTRWPPPASRRPASLAALRRSRRPCRGGGALAAGAAAGGRDPPPWTVPERQPGAGLGAARSWPRRLARLDRRADRHGSELLASRPAAARRRRAGAGAPARRLRPRPGAGAEGAQACRWPASTAWC